MSTSRFDSRRRREPGTRRPERSRESIHRSSAERKTSAPGAASICWARVDPQQVGDHEVDRVGDHERPHQVGDVEDREVEGELVLGPPHPPPDLLDQAEDDGGEDQDRGVVGEDGTDQHPGEEDVGEEAASAAVGASCQRGAEQLEEARPFRDLRQDHQADDRHHRRRQQPGRGEQEVRRADPEQHGQARAEDGGAAVVDAHAADLRAPEGEPDGDGDDRESGRLSHPAPRLDQYSPPMPRIARAAAA
jgi:hypothetical protein